MTTWEDEQLAMLRLRYPAWDIWHVRNVVSRHVTWHVRPAGGSVATVHADSPEELVRKIADAETGE